MLILVVLAVYSPVLQEHVAEIPEYLVLVEYQPAESMVVLEVTVLHPQS